MCPPDGPLGASPNQTPLSLPPTPLAASPNPVPHSLPPPPQYPPLLSPGKILLERYRIVKLLGKGTYSEVYRAIDIQKPITDRNSAVAIKLLCLNRHIDAHRQFIQERTSLLKLGAVNNLSKPPFVGEHHVIKLLSFHDGIMIDNQEVVILIIEFASLGNFFEFLVSYPLPIDEKLIRTYFKQILMGLAYCHTHNIAHRDLKPENILMDALCQIKIADFGMSREIIRNYPMHTQCGTNPYVAPEQFIHTTSTQVIVPSYDGKISDIWAAGMMLFKLLARDLPFRQPFPTDVNFQKLIYDPPAFWEHHKAKFSFPVSAHYKDLVQKMLNPNPLLRISMENIGRHPWFNGETVTDDEVHRIMLIVATPSASTSGQHQPPPQILAQPIRNAPRTQAESRERFLYEEKNEEKMNTRSVHSQQMNEITVSDSDSSTSDSSFEDDDEEEEEEDIEMHRRDVDKKTRSVKFLSSESFPKTYRNCKKFEPSLDEEDEEDEEVVEEEKISPGHHTTIADLAEEAMLKPPTSVSPSVDVSSSLESISLNLLPKDTALSFWNRDSNTPQHTVTNLHSTNNLQSLYPNIVTTLVNHNFAVITSPSTAELTATLETAVGSIVIHVQIFNSIDKKEKIVEFKRWRGDGMLYREIISYLQAKIRN